MKVQTFEYCVARDSSTQIYVTCPSYEAAVMSVLFGKVNVVKGEEAAVIDVEPEAEITRLANKFGLGTLEHVYGAAFETTLESAIEACAAKLEKPKAVKKAVKKTEADVTAEAVDAE